MPPKKKGKPGPFEYGGWDLPQAVVKGGGGGGQNKGKGKAAPAQPAAPAPAPTPAAPAADPAAAEQAQQQQSAWAYMQQQLDQYGLSSLAGVVQNLISQGMTDENQLTLALQETQEWKTRFAGNEKLRQMGLPVLSVAEYLSVERSYAQIMKNYGLPTGFYDDPSDFAQFIGNSVSANELQQRVMSYADLANREDPAIKSQLASMGIADGDLLAYMMDPTRAAPLIQAKYKEALVGSAARRNGLTTSNAARLAELGVTEQQAIQGFGLISENLGDVQRTGSIYGEDYTQGEFEAEVFEQQGAATKKRKRLASRERAAFSGTSGVGQGSLTRDSGGSY